MMVRQFRMWTNLKIESPVYAIGAAIAVIVGFLLSGLAQQLEHWSTDLQIAYLSERRAAQYPNIALIVVNDDTMQGSHYTLPVDRRLIADLVDRLDAAGATLIGLDFIFDRPTEPDKDNRLVESIRKANATIVLGALDKRTELPERNRLFQSQFLDRLGRPVGHLYFDENQSPLVLSDRVVRFFAPPPAEDSARKSFAEVMASAYGQAVSPTTPYISWLLPPKNQSETFLTLSAAQVLGRNEGLVPVPLHDLIRNKIVLVGGEFSDRDQHLIPLSLASAERHSGLFIHAQMLAQLLDRRSIGTIVWPLELLILITAACSGIWLGRRDRFGHYHLWIKSVGIVSLIAVSAVVFSLLGIIFPITLTLLFLLAGTAFGYHSKRFV